MIVYLAHPIDHHTGTLDAAVVEARAILHDRGHVVFDPAGAWAVPPHAEMSLVLQSVNDTALVSASAVLAILDPQVMSIGVPLELSLASRAGIPAAVFGLRQRSWSLPEVQVYTELEPAIVALEDAQ